MLIPRAFSPASLLYLKDWALVQSQRMTLKTVLSSLLTHTHTHMKATPITHIHAHESHCER